MPPRRGEGMTGSPTACPQHHQWRRPHNRPRRRIHSLRRTGPASRPCGRFAVGPAGRALTPAPTSARPETGRRAEKKTRKALDREDSFRDDPLAARRFLPIVATPEVVGSRDGSGSSGAGAAGGEARGVHRVDLARGVERGGVPDRRRQSADGKALATRACHHEQRRPTAALSTCDRHVQAGDLGALPVRGGADRDRGSVAPRLHGARHRRRGAPQPVDDQPGAAPQPGPGHRCVPAVHRTAPGRGPPGPSREARRRPGAAPVRRRAAADEVESAADLPGAARGVPRRAGAPPGAGDRLPGGLPPGPGRAAPRAAAGAAHRATPSEAAPASGRPSPRSSGGHDDD